MPETFEEKYEDVLQNIEFALMQLYHVHPEMLDWDALEGVGALIRVYQAEARNKPPPALKLKALHQEIFDSVQAMCEWRLGRGQLPDKQVGAADAQPAPRTVVEIVECLKRVRRSIELWTKELGRRGYYEFVGGYVR